MPDMTGHHVHGTHPETRLSASLSTGQPEPQGRTSGKRETGSQSARRTWQIPDEPDPDTNAVTDHDALIWRRDPDDPYRRWHTTAEHAPTVPLEWWDLVRYRGPLREWTVADDRYVNELPF